MLDFQQKRKVRGLMYNRVTIGVLVLLVFWFAHSTYEVYKKMKESENIKNISLNNLEKLKDRNEDLTLKIDKLDTEYGVEEEIRSRFSVAKEDEEMVIILEDPDSNAALTHKKLTFWQKIRDFFGF